MTDALTDEQAAVYDRQIRVWGADVQKRLTGAKVLLQGCTALAAEVAKNFVLAGVGSLTLVDDTPASQLAVTFLHSPQAVKGAATAADLFAAGLQELNPMVAVQTAPGAPSTLPEAAVVAAHHLVLSFDAHAGYQARLNALCRAQGAAFMAGVCRAGTAVCFADLGKHAYKLTADADAAPQALEYVPLAQAVEHPWEAATQRAQKQMSPVLAAWCTTARFEVQQDRAACAADRAEVAAAGAARAASQDVRSGVWDEDALAGLLNAGAAAFPPAAAIVGGFMANDVVRAISHVGLPMHNALFFSMATGIAQVHALGVSPPPS